MSAAFWAGDAGTSVCNECVCCGWTKAGEGGAQADVGCFLGRCCWAECVPRVRLLSVWIKSGEGGALADVGCFWSSCCWDECVAGATGIEWGMVVSHDVRLRGGACVMLHCFSGLRSCLMQSLFGAGLLLCPSFGLIQCLLLLLVLAKYLPGFNCESVQIGVASIGIARRAACGRMLVT